MTDDQQDEWYEDDDDVDYDALWQELYADLDRAAFCFCCGFELVAGECVNPYCTENPAFISEDNGPE